MPKNSGNAEEQEKSCGCKISLAALSELESLASQKAKIYSRLLTETSLAEDMGALSARHEQRLKDLKALLGEEYKADNEEQSGGEEE